MVEIRLWKWEYTDADGKRKVSRWLMTEHEAVKYREPVRLQHTLHVRYDPDAGPLTRGQRVYEPGVGLFFARNRSS